MVDQSNRPPVAEQRQKKKIPIYILIVVGIFLAAFVFYMLADKPPEAGEVPANTNIPATDATATATANEGTAVDNTVSAVASDRQN